MEGIFFFFFLIYHCQTVVQEADKDKYDTAARICSGNGTESEYKSNLSQCGAPSQWLTSRCSAIASDGADLQEAD